MAPAKKGLVRVRFLTHVTHGFELDSELYPPTELLRRAGNVSYTETVPTSLQFEAGSVYDLPEYDAEVLLESGLVELADKSDKPENEADLNSRAAAAHAAAQARAKPSAAPQGFAPLATPVEDEDEETEAEPAKTADK
jgi:hypothetical protein